MKGKAVSSDAKVARFAAPILFGGSLTLLSHGALALCSGASLSFPGEMPVSKPTAAGGMLVALSNIQQKHWGMMTRSSLSIPPAPMTFSVTTPFGDGHYSFEFSSNVTKIRLALKGETLYEGPPIKTFDASKKPRGTLDVEFQWSGKDLTLTVADACAGPRPMGSQGAP